MYTLVWARAAQWGSTTPMMPKYCQRQTFVQFETLAKNQNIEKFGSDKQSIKPLQHQTRCDLPMGTKRASFLSRKPPVKQQKVLRSQTFVIENNFVPSTQFMFDKQPISPQYHSIQADPITQCQPTIDPLVQSSSPSSRKPPSNPGPNLEIVAYQLTQDLTNIFMQRQEWSMYHKEVVLHDNIRGVKVFGLEKYMLLVNILRVLAHIRFVYVRMSLLSLTKDKEEGTIKVRWRVVGLGMGRLVLRYFPDRLWENGNMERLSPSYLDGYSTFYVDSNSKIYQHTVDRVMEDRDKAVVKSLVQKLLELKPKPAAQPAL